MDLKPPAGCLCLTYQLVSPLPVSCSQLTVQPLSGTLSNHVHPHPVTLDHRLFLSEAGEANNRYTFYQMQPSAHEKHLFSPDPVDLSLFEIINISENVGWVFIPS